jgi:UDP-N-acetylglucosamine--N-acetylmuramyl-(pentapeptide) pyrophosphoryl-undecaprenol N-acetylglucosamine transferase
MKNSEGKNIIIAVSGTGGHIYPGICLAQQFQTKGFNPIFWTSKNETALNIVKQSGFNYVPFGFVKMPKIISFTFILFAIKFFLAFIKSLFYLLKLKPVAVIGTGGYIQVPAIFAAKLIRKKTFIHEQNAFPGKANRLLNKFVDKTFISFAQSQKYFSKKVYLSGCPIRKDVFDANKIDACKSLDLDENKFTIFIFGGSLGAIKINDAAFEAISQLAKQETVQVIHISGQRGFEELSKKAAPLPFYKVKNYMHDIYNAYAACDIIICRAGAGSVFEILALNKPAIFIPLASAADNHQFLNADAVKKDGFIELIEQKDLSPQKLLETIKKLKQAQNKNTPQQKTFAQDGIVFEIIKVID